MQEEAKWEERHKYLPVNDVDVWASRAEVTKGTIHTGILYQQEIRTCWTEIHLSPQLLELHRSQAAQRFLFWVFTPFNSSHLHFTQSDGETNDRIP